MMIMNNDRIPDIIIPSDIDINTDEEFKLLSDFIDEFGWDYKSILNRYFNNSVKYNKITITKEILKKFNEDR